MKSNATSSPKECWGFRGRASESDAAFARSQGESGLMPHLAGYFKNPAGVEEHTFVKQIALLEHYVASHRGKRDERARS